MIFDHLENAVLYRGLGENFRKGLDFLARPGLGQIPEGRHEIDGEKVFALAQEYLTRARVGAKWESHRRFADIQFLAAGREIIGCARVAGLRPLTPYSPEKDCALYEGEGNFLVMESGLFAVFFPDDAHLPGISAPEGPEKVRKIVVKIMLESNP